MNTVSYAKIIALIAAILLALLPMTALADDAGDFTVTGGTAGTSYTYSSNTLTFLEPGDYTVEMRSGVTSTGTDKIVVNALGSTAANPVHITLSGVDIQLSSGCAFQIASGSYARLTLSGSNRLSSTGDCAGLQVAGGSFLTIDGDGSLAADGGANGAGIGGSIGQDGGHITILGGTIHAYSAGQGAGIGGGFGGNGGSVVISGGDVTANSGFSGAGIGGGSQDLSGNGGDGGTITISDGLVGAFSDTYGAGIGGGKNGSGGTIAITGGLVDAWCNYDGAGIGGGANGDGGTITISGGVITTGGGSEGGAGVGGGNHGSSGGAITISGGKLCAVSYGYGAAIGGGSGGSGGVIRISGTADIVARGDDSGSGYGHGAGIGGGNNGDGGDIGISGGRVSATGGADAAGIGGGDGGDGGIIAISGGTVQATGTGEGAGIGGGGNGDGATVIITGGSIAAIPGAVLPPEYGIGGGLNGSAGTIRDGSGRDVYYTYVALDGVGAATGITSLTVDSGAYGISDMYTDEYGCLYLYLPNGAHTTEARTANKRYTGYVTTRANPNDSYGTLMWYRQIDTDGTYNIGDYYADGQTLHIDGGLNVTLTGSAGATYTNFQLECGAGVHLTLQDVNIDDSTINNACPLSFTGTGNTLTLAGANTMKAGNYEPSVRVETGTELTIDGAGSLTATGGDSAAGIGGGHSGNGGTVTINDGTVTAMGGFAGAGIGGGGLGNGGTVTISGGTVTATGGDTGAGIGGGSGDDGDGGSIEISGGTVTATGGDYGAGIGGGWQGDGGTVTLSGGMIFAAGMGGAKDIGAENTGSGGTLEITDTAAVFLRNDNCVIPVTAAHTHVDVTDPANDMYGIPNTAGWAGGFGAYLHLCTLSFDANGGIGILPASEIALYGWEITVPDGSELSRTGYAFAGWNTQADGGGVGYGPDSVYTYVENTVLYAQWSSDASPNSGSGNDRPPTVFTGAASNITPSGAALSGSVRASGGTAVKERGFVFGTSANPVIGGAGVERIAAGSGIGDFTEVLFERLTPGMVYHVRAYAINAEGVGYGASVSFRTADIIANGIPKTGDGSSDLAWWLLCGISAMGIAVLTIWRKKKTSCR